jgi:hypothetical protein
MINGVIARYDVYAYDETECIHDYIGDNFDLARTSFENLKSIHIQSPISEDVTVVLYDNWNEKIIEDYNTLNDG